MANGLLGVTYSQFDNVVGPQLLYSYPDVMSKESFENLSEYVIVGKHLCNKIIIVKTEDLQYVNYSMAIDNQKYERNALLFSFGFILSRDVESEPFEPILRKLSSTFLSLELEREYLFHDTTRNLIPIILRSLYEELIVKGEAFIEIDPNNFLAVKLFRSPILPPQVHDYQVPILCYDRQALINLPWDIAIRHLLGAIDGVSHVKKLAAREAGMDADIVKRCLRTLIHYNCVILSDIMRFSNIYQLTPVGRSVCSESPQNSTSSVHTDMAMFASLDKDAPPPSISSILRLLSCLRPGRTLGEVVLQFGYHNCVGINLRRLLAFAQNKGIVRRIHNYPVCMSRAASSFSATAAATTIPTVFDPALTPLPQANSVSNESSPKRCTFSDSQATQYFNGTNSLDTLCTTFELSPQIINETPGVCILQK